MIYIYIMHVKEHSWFCQAHTLTWCGSSWILPHHRKTELGIADASWSWGRPLQGAGSFQGPSQDSQVTKNTMSLLWFYSLDYDLEIREWWLLRFSGYWWLPRFGGLVCVVKDGGKFWRLVLTNLTKLLLRWTPHVAHVRSKLRYSIYPVSHWIS